MEARALANISGDTLSLSGVIDYESVLELDQQGRRWLQGAGTASCQVDAGKISYSGSVGIALLLGWLRLAQELKKKLFIVNLPEPMIALAKVGGLETLLMSSSV